MTKNILTKILYLLAAIIFIVWVLPQAMTYFSNVEKYEESNKKLTNMAKMHGLETPTQSFSEVAFKKETKSLFSDVKIKKLQENQFEVNIDLKKDALENFHTFIETLSLRYYVEIENSIEFQAKDDMINVTMVLKTY